MLLYTIHETLDNYFIMVIALVIPNAFNKAWHRGLLCKFSGYRITKSLTGKSLLMASLPKSIRSMQAFPKALLGLIFFMRRSLVNIYLDNATAYGCIWKKKKNIYLDDQILADNFSSGLTLAAQWDKETCLEHSISLKSN